MEFVHKFLQGEGYSLASILDALNNFMAATDDDYAATLALDAWARSSPFWLMLMTFSPPTRVNSGVSLISTVFLSLKTWTPRVLLVN